MIKVYCDRCETEVDGNDDRDSSIFEFSKSILIGANKKFEMRRVKEIYCRKCTDKVLDAMDLAEKEHRQAKEAARKAALESAEK